MVTHKVSVSDEAKVALQSIYNWLKENESATTARKVRDGLLDEIAGLAQMPERHGIALEIENDHVTYRRVIKWSYRIIFAIDDDKVEVLVVDVIHAKQNPKQLQEKFGN
jgi:plasmid stabilization system protein ParE